MSREAKESCSKYVTLQLNAFPTAVPLQLPGQHCQVPWAFTLAFTSPGGRQGALTETPCFPGSSSSFCTTAILPLAFFLFYRNIHHPCLGSLYHRGHTLGILYLYPSSESQAWVPNYFLTSLLRWPIGTSVWAKHSTSAPERLPWAWGQFSLFREILSYTPPNKQTTTKKTISLKMSKTELSIFLRTQPPSLLFSPIPDAKSRNTFHLGFLKLTPFFPKITLLISPWINTIAI